MLLFSKVSSQSREHSTQVTHHLLLTCHARASSTHSLGCAYTAGPVLVARHNSRVCNCRQPEFSGGDRSCWWELTCLGGHVHPSVAAFARNLLAGSYISYDGDPLRDLTLTAFLDKFVQRKPKVSHFVPNVLHWYIVN